MKSFLSFSLLALSLSASAQQAKTTATKKRVIATSYAITGGMTDSTHYYYSAGRGSANTTKESYFDNYYPQSTAPQLIKSDSSVSWMSGSATLLRNETRIYSYNTDGSLKDYSLKNTNYGTVSRSERYYNTTKQLVGMNYADTMNGTEFVNDMRFYDYNSAGKITKDSQYSQKYNMPVSVTTYTYNSANNITKTEISIFVFTGWVLSYTGYNTYDVQNRLTLFRSDNGPSNAAKHYDTKDSFSYTGTYTLPVTKHHYTWDTLSSSWQNDNYSIYHYNSKDLIDTTYLYQYGTQWDTTEMNVNTYDADGLLLYSKSYQYSTTTHSYNTINYDELKIYYENYDPTVSVSNTTISHKITVTPNPSKGIISINTGNTTFSSIRITDMQGRIVYTQSLPEANSTTINTQLPPGNYVLTVQNKQGTNITATQLIIQ